MSSSPYAPAAAILNQVWTGKKKQQRSLKSVVYTQKGELTCSKTTFAQCSHVLEHKNLLDQVLMTSKCTIEAKNRGLFYILLHELLLGPNQAIRGGGALKRQLLKQQTELQKALWQHQPIHNTDVVEETLREIKSNAITIPRYVRVNTLQTTTKNVVEALLEATPTLEVFLDPHIPDVLVLAPTSESRALLQPFVASNQVVLQDKSSCFSAYCLVAGFDDDATDTCGAYLDCCAAPGNKTSHLAMLLSSRQRKNDKATVVYALDKSHDRFQLLKRRMKDLVPDDSRSANASLSKTTVECHEKDFLQATPTDFSAPISAIMLDPSCSGSGMTKSNHRQYLVSSSPNGIQSPATIDSALLDPNHSNSRIESLCGFQSKALSHAATAFPSVRRIVYSTCSLYKAENEGVVGNFLKHHGTEWELVAPKCLSNWKRRGIYEDSYVIVDDETSAKRPLTKEECECLIRVDPQHDATNGFFVACLQRKKRYIDNGKADVMSKIELYTNQFDTTQSKTRATPSTKGKPHRAEFASKSKKRKNEDLHIVLEERRGDLPASAVNKTIVSKKLSKKTEWKRKQHAQKLKRLKLTKHAD